MTTLDQSDVSALLDALRAGDGVDLVRDLVRLVLQELVEAEATGTIGASRYERAEGRLTERNGHRPKTRLPEFVGKFGRPEEHRPWS